jgi:FemAB-related protein (PEP-CTERM system-associated)
MNVRIESFKRNNSNIMQVKRLQDSDWERWDQFVFSLPQATFFHRVGWKHVIEQAFGHNTHYLYAEQEGKLLGVLPLVHLRSILFGNSLISLPFCAYGGILASTEDAQNSLQNGACALALELHVDYLEMRNLSPQQPYWPTKDLYVTFRKQIDSDPEKNLLAIPRKQRAMIRKGIKAGLRAEVDRTINRFYDAYSQSVRNLGTPVFSRKYFKLLQEAFGSDCEILTVTQNERTIASVMSFYFRNEVLPYYGGGTSESRAFKGNDFMYWELMRRCSDKKIQIFDYGRSKLDSGSFRFKKHWGFQPEKLYYQYYFVKSKVMPNISPSNPKYRYFIETWKRLPLSLTRFIGPKLAAYLG